MLFRNIVLIFNLEKPCYLENCVVREPCKQRTACRSFLMRSKMAILLFIITEKDTLQPSKKMKYFVQKNCRFRIREKHAMNSLIEEKSIIEERMDY